MRCFECGDVGHKRFACPHKQRAADKAGAPSAEADPGEGTSGQGEKGVSQDVSSPEAVSIVPEQQLEKAQADVNKKTANVSPEASSEDSINNGAVSITPPVAEEIEPGQDEQASGEGPGAEPPVIDSQRNEEDDEMEYDSDSDDMSGADSLSQSGDVYTLQEINTFLDETFAYDLACGRQAVPNWGT
ncbi:hypothetical protein SKAU_G00421940 [Synaphobranchus kaupii]|uniref:CCHC-type domain-containing protein n=1 Tax=Synaphobranchus kaupii TaxID=118154 RepID=A0A9Q1I9C4_SYNKA|nr:hypothetical protein SKAU_G00421940 [Synaphobranchus kaupii]